MFRVMLPALAICLASTAALAEPQYRAEDIVKHFATMSQEPPTAERQRTRELYLGTEGFGDDQALAIPKTGDHNSESAGGTKTAPGAQARPASGGYDLLITFELGSDRLTRQARQNLDQFARALSDPSLSGLTFLVEGHTDARGSADYNQTLSEGRAASVVRYLTGLGIPRGRLRAQGHGETRPLVNDPFAPQNRRVEARVMR